MSDMQRYKERLEHLQDRVARYHNKMSWDEVKGRWGNIVASLNRDRNKGCYEHDDTEYHEILDMLQEGLNEIEDEFYATFSQTM